VDADMLSFEPLLGHNASLMHRDGII
jgi:hypothetical protein